MQADGFESRVGRLPAHFGSTIGGNFPRVERHGERSILDARVTAFTSQRERAIERPVDERFITNGVFHGNLAGTRSGELQERKKINVTTMNSGIKIAPL